MAEPNGTNEYVTGNPKVDAALKRLNGRFKDLEDAVIVQVHLEKRMTEGIKRHAEVIAAHDEWMLHFQDKLNALTDMMMRREGGFETR